MGANATVSESDALVLGGSGVNVGIGTSSPVDLLQVGTLSTSFGNYAQLAVVNTSSAPPAADCSGGTVGRMMITLPTGSSTATLWICTANGIWKSYLG